MRHIMANFMDGYDEKGEREVEGARYLVWEEQHCCWGERYEEEQQTG